MLQNLHLSRRRKPSINLKADHFTSTDLIHLHCSRINLLCGDNIHLKDTQKKRGVCKRICSDKIKEKVQKGQKEEENF